MSRFIPLLLELPVGSAIRMLLTRCIDPPGSEDHASVRQRVRGRDQATSHPQAVHEREVGTNLSGILAEELENSEFVPAAAPGDYTTNCLVFKSQSAFFASVRWAEAR